MAVAVPYSRDRQRRVRWAPVTGQVSKTSQTATLIERMRSMEPAALTLGTTASVPAGEPQTRGMRGRQQPRARRPHVISDANGIYYMTPYSLPHAPPRDDRQARGRPCHGSGRRRAGAAVGHILAPASGGTYGHVHRHAERKHRPDRLSRPHRREGTDGRHRAHRQRVHRSGWTDGSIRTSGVGRTVRPDRFDRGIGFDRLARSAGFDRSAGTAWAWRAAWAAWADRTRGGRRPHQPNDT